MCIIIFSYKNCLHFKQDQKHRRFKFLIFLNYAVYCIPREVAQKARGHNKVIKQLWKCSPSSDNRCGHLVTPQHHYLASFPTHMKKVPSATVLY